MKRLTESEEVDDVKQEELKAIREMAYKGMTKETKTVLLMCDEIERLRGVLQEIYEYDETQGTGIAYVHDQARAYWKVKEIASKALKG
jgi:hypothetical protein